MSDIRNVTVTYDIVGRDGRHTSNVTLGPIPGPGGGETTEADIPLILAIWLGVPRTAILVQSVH